MRLRNCESSGYCISSLEIYYVQDRPMHSYEPSHLHFKQRCNTSVRMVNVSNYLVSLRTCLWEFNKDAVCKLRTILLFIFKSGAMSFKITINRPTTKPRRYPVIAPICTETSNLNGPDITVFSTGQRSCNPILQITNCL